LCHRSVNRDVMFDSSLMCNSCECGFRLEKLMVSTKGALWTQHMFLRLPR
jgi:hypothetical protein